MGAIQKCCRQQKKSQQLQIKKCTKKPKHNQEETASIPDSSTNGQTIEQLGPLQNFEENLSDENIDLILAQRSRNQRKTCLNDFQIDGELGKGGFGVVYLGQLKQNILQGKVERYAIKRIQKELLIQKKVYLNALHERNILAMHDCKFIVALIMAFQDPWSIYFVLECAFGGDTYSLIKKDSPRFQDFKALGENAIRFIAGCVILGLEFVHNNKYMYRDLKPENVLIFEDGYIKLTDFGLAKKSQEGCCSKTVLGTKFYYAPEMVLGKGYNKQIDLWTLGVYLYELSNFEPPFGLEQITKKRFQAACLEAEKGMTWKNENLTPELKNLIQNLLKFEPKERLGANGWQEVKQHQFFDNFDWKALEEQKMKSPLKEIVKKYPSPVISYRPEPRKPTKIKYDKLQGITYDKYEKNKQQNMPQYQAS